MWKWIEVVFGAAMVAGGGTIVAYGRVCGYVAVMLGISTLLGAFRRDEVQELLRRTDEEADEVEAGDQELLAVVEAWPKLSADVRRSVLAAIGESEGPNSRSTDG